MAVGNITPQLPNAGTNLQQTAQLPPSTIGTVSKATVATGAATNITLQATTSLVEINVCNAAGLNGLYVRWQTGATTSLFDEYVLPGTRHYVKPDGVTVISYIADGAATEVRTIEK
jgi:hypothetical protein